MRGIYKRRGNSESKDNEMALAISAENRYEGSDSDQEYDEQAFLEALCEQQMPLSIYLVNGIKLQGYLRSCDKDTVFLEGGGMQMIYKHAISTVVPVRSP